MNVKCWQKASALEKNKNLLAKKNVSINFKLNHNKNDEDRTPSVCFTEQTWSYLLLSRKNAL